MRKSLMLLGVGAVLAFLTGCCCDQCDKADDGHKMAAMNANCPFSGRPANQDMTAEWHGSKVAFCCAGCKGKFEKMSDADKQAAMAKAK